MRRQVVVFVLFAIGACHAAESISPRSKRSLLFTPAAGMGIYLAVAFPVDLPQYELSMSFNVEANYFLPTNATELAYGPLYTEVKQARHLTRRSVYTYIEDHLEKEGFLSKPCLLRAICETSASSVVGHNGLLGELLHIIFTPSTSEPEDMPKEYGEAEEDGFSGREHCESKYSHCPIDLYQLFSVWSQ